MLIELGKKIEFHSKRYRFLYHFFNRHVIKNKKHRQLIRDSFPYIQRINDWLDFTIIEKEYLELQLKDTGLKLRINDPIDVYLIYEIFASDIYAFHSHYNDITVIDVGMNVGMASLFFAKNDQVKKVYAFEPVKKTFQEAQFNIGLNEEYRQKIKSFNFGLWNESTSAYFAVPPGNKGAAALQEEDSSSSDQVLVTLQEANFLEESIFTNIEERFLVKMDCEGAEHILLPYFEKRGYLDKIDFMIIEWHHNRKDIFTLLDRNNFNFYFRRFPPDRENHGLIYAFKSNPSV